MDILWFWINCVDKIYLQIVGLIVVVLSAIPKCAIDQSILLQHSIFGIGGRLPMLFFLALSIVQIAAIVSGNENRILVGNISKLHRKIQITPLSYQPEFENNDVFFVVIFIYILGHLYRSSRIDFLPSIWIGSITSRSWSSSPNSSYSS